MASTPGEDASEDSRTLPERETPNRNRSFVPDVEQWAAWTPAEISRRLAGVQAPWYVAAGWAIDLFLGGSHREHEDLEIAAPIHRFDEIAGALPELEFFVIGDGRAWAMDDADDAWAEHHQTWGRERETGLWRVDLFREPSIDGRWVCRRDHTIRLPYEQVIARTTDGIPFARPEIALLFKAKALREKDDADFAAVLPRLEAPARTWLAGALSDIHPRHPWIAQLT